MAPTLGNFQRKPQPPGLGSVPRQHSTGGKQKLGPSKQGDRYLRRVLVVGVHPVLRRARQQTGRLYVGAWNFS
jgi:transposase